MGPIEVGILQSVYKCVKIHNMRVNISMPDELIARFDSLLTKKGYKRSTYIQFLIKRFVEEQEDISQYPTASIPSVWVSPPVPVSPKIAPKKASKYCPHGIAPGGFCLRCLEGK